MVDFYLNRMWVDLRLDIFVDLRIDSWMCLWVNLWVVLPVVLGGGSVSGPEDDPVRRSMGGCVVVLWVDLWVVHEGCPAGGPESGWLFALFYNCICFLIRQCGILVHNVLF